jgi:uncharacterized protein (DUF2062 family)
MGVFLGFMPFRGYHTIFWLLAFIVFRLSPFALLVSAALFKCLNTYAGLEPFSYTLGNYLLDQTSPRLISYLQSFCSWPVVSVWEFDRYTMAGSFVLSTGGALLAYLITRLFYHWLAGSKMLKFFKKMKLVHSPALWLLGDKPCQGNSWIRGRLLVYLLVLAILAAGTFALLCDMVVKNWMEKWGPEMLGAPLQAQGASYNIWHNKLMLHGVTLGDPTNPEMVLFSANLVELDMRMRSLLSQGQLVFEKVSVRDGTLRLNRTQEGRFNFAYLKIFARDAHYLKEITPADWQAWNLDAAYQKFLATVNPDWVQELRRWVLEQKGIQEYKARLRTQRMEEYKQKQNSSEEILEVLLNVSSLDGLEPLLKLSPYEIKLLVGQPTYLKRNAPRTICQELEAKDVTVEVFTAPQHLQTFKCSLAIQNLSSQPRVYQPLTGTLGCKDMAVSAFLPIYQNSVPLVFEQGSINWETSFQYHPSENVVLGEGKLQLQNSKVSINTGVSMFGISLNRLLQNLNKSGDYQISFQISGQPYRLRFESPELMKDIALEGVNEVVKEGVNLLNTITNTIPNILNKDNKDKATPKK